MSVSGEYVTTSGAHLNSGRHWNKVRIWLVVSERGTEEDTSLAASNSGNAAPVSFILLVPIPAVRYRRLIASMKNVTWRC
jgi:hypothetical protein